MTRGHGARTARGRRQGAQLGRGVHRAGAEDVDADDVQAAGQ